MPSFSKSWKVLTLLAMLQSSKYYLREVPSHHRCIRETHSPYIIVVVRALWRIRPLRKIMSAKSTAYTIRCFEYFPVDFLTLLHEVFENICGIETSNTASNDADFKTPRFNFRCFVRMVEEI